MTSEERDVDNSGSVDETTTYAYDHTQQTSKTVFDNTASQNTSQTTFAYDLQGRLNVATVTTYTSGTESRIEKTTYNYDADGIRVSALNQIDTDANGSWDETTNTEYLVDHQNFTGYQQVIKETVYDENGNVVKVIEYNFGHDEISQTVTEYDGSGNVTSEDTHVFGHDGHGSVKVLYDVAAAIAQVYTYEAYGQMLAIHNAIAGVVTTGALTSLQYSGEQFDSRIGQQYLRARYYDPNTGRFNRLDPFAGNSQDPQSFHKYLYTHGNPVMGMDPTGLAEFTIAGVTVNITAPTAATFSSFGSLKAYAFVAFFEASVQVAELTFIYEVFDFTLTLTILGIESIPDDYTNPNHGTNAPITSYEVGEHADLLARAQRNGQTGEFRIHHAPQKALASKVIPGYSPPPSPTEPAIALPVGEHSSITSAQFNGQKDRFSTPPSQEDLVARDFFHVKKYTSAPLSQLRRLAGMVKGRYPSLFSRYKR